MTDTFHKFIILTMMLPFAHDSAIRWSRFYQGQSFEVGTDSDAL